MIAYITAFVLVLLSSVTSLAASDLDIRPVKDGWNADRENVRRVLVSSASVIYENMRDYELSPILVEPTGGPITLFGRGTKGEYRVKLATGGHLWAQQAYQFAHEFTHICCNFQRGENPNKWFEESLCEMASLYSVRRMSVVWAQDPPYPNWRSYSEALARYAADRMNEVELLDDEAFVEWFKKEEVSLRKDSVQRKKNLVVARKLLVCFEAKPELWKTIRFLNVGRSPDETFSRYLGRWQSKCTENAQSISIIAKQFGVRLTAQKEP